MARDELEVLAARDVRRALEHHVLEEVREAGVPALLVAPADVVDDVDRDRRRRVVGREHDAQAVVELGALEGQVDLELGLGRVRAGLRVAARCARASAGKARRAAAARARATFMVEFLSRRQHAIES